MIGGTEVVTVGGDGPGVNSKTRRSRIPGLSDGRRNAGARPRRVVPTVLAAGEVGLMSAGRVLCRFLNRLADLVESFGGGEMARVVNEYSNGAGTTVIRRQSSETRERCRSEFRYSRAPRRTSEPTAGCVAGAMGTA